MSKVRPQDITGLRTTRSAKRAVDAGADACELVVAELQARRVRLQELLSLVYREAAGTRDRKVKRVPAHTHSRRQPMGMKRIA